MSYSKTTVAVFLVACLTIGGLVVWSIDFADPEVAELPNAQAVENAGGDRPMDVNGLLRWVR